MKYLLLLSLPDMLIIVCDLIPGLFLFGVVGGQGLVEDLVVDLFQIIVAVGHILLRPAPVYIRRKKLPVIMADTAWAHHAGYGCTDKITLLSIVLTSCKSHLTIAPARGQPLFVPFSWEKRNAKALHHHRPALGAGSMKVLLRAPAGNAGVPATAVSSYFRSAPAGDLAPPPAGCSQRIQL